MDKPAETPIQLQPTLEGPHLTLRPLLATDFAQLLAAASDPDIWEQHPEPTRWRADVFQRFFDSALASGSAFAVVDQSTGHIIGTSRYYEWDPDQKAIAIGYTFLARAWWGGTANREMKQLMLEHIFQWADTVWFHVGRDNWRSRKAMEKIGGELAQYTVRETAGSAVDYAYYRICKPAALPEDTGNSRVLTGN